MSRDSHNDSQGKRILLTGGGTGGHITPLLAVAQELKNQDPTCHIIYVGERNGKFNTMMDGISVFDETHSIFAGKFRRYYGESWLKRLIDVKTNLLNLRDFFYFCIGTVQSIVLIKRLKPHITLLKGGFVGLPVGLACVFWHRPFVTHDSDALPGLANRLVSRWATKHATGMPVEYYRYPPERTVYVGVLVEKEYQLVSEELQRNYKTQLGLPASAPVLLITGGSSGAKSINMAIKEIVPKLLTAYPNLYIIHQVGRGNKEMYEDFHQERLHVFELLRPLYVSLGAADVVVTRAGANTIAELGIQGKACIVVPNPLLTGGHQTKNATHLENSGAAVVVKEATLSQSDNLLTAIKDLLDNPKKRTCLGEKLHALTVPDATKKLARLLLAIGS